MSFCPLPVVPAPAVGTLSSFYANNRAKGVMGNSSLKFITWSNIMSNAQTDFGFEDVTPNAKSGKSENKKDIFLNLGYKNKKGEEFNLNSMIALEKAVNGLQEILVEVLEECPTEEEALKTANELLGRLFVRSVWIKSKAGTGKKKFSRDDL